MKSLSSKARWPGNIDRLIWPVAPEPASPKNRRGARITPIAVLRLLQIHASYLATPYESAVAQTVNSTKMRHVKHFGTIRAQMRLSMSGSEVRLLIPAVMISQSRRGFEIGCLIVLLIKILFFILVDA